jgi:2-methylcitrate dehydratase
MLSELERKLILYARDLRFDEVPAEALHQTKRRILDTLGGALAAYHAPPSRIARRLAQPVGEGPTARVWGSLSGTTPESAAFANGTMLRYLDINDTYRTKDGGHPSDNLGAVLAVAEMVDATGGDAILALIISYEIQCRFVDAVGFNDAGWDQPVPGAMACALAAGRLLQLSEDAMRNALALAVIPNLCTYQTRAGELSMWKGCAAANGARQGVFAARLAAAGMTGPYQAFDGVFGVWKQTMGRPHELPPLTRGEGTYAVQQSNIKMYPVRDSCQLPVTTAQSLRSKISPSQIERVEITTYGSAYKGAVADPELWAPQTRETADHSMPFSVAVCLLDGDVTPETFERARFGDADVLRVIGRMSIKVSDEFSAAAPAVRNCRIETWTKDGSSSVAHLKLTREDIERGPSDHEIETKFTSLTREVLSSKVQRALIDGADRIERMSNIGELIELTRIDAERA